MDTKTRKERERKTRETFLYVCALFVSVVCLQAPEIKDGEVSYNEGDVLGEGTFGVVYKGKCRGCNVAIKIPKSGSASVEALSEKQLEGFKVFFFFFFLFVFFFFFFFVFFKKLKGCFLFI
jgi:hypothetical protein